MKISVIVPVGDEAQWKCCEESIATAVSAAHSAVAFEVLPCFDLEHTGAFNARNVGLDAAAGDWISFVDSDDCVDERYFSSLLEAAKEEDANISSVGTASCTPEEYWCSNKCMAVTAWGMVYRAELWKDVRFPDGRLHEDEFTVHKVVFKVMRIAGVREMLYRYTNRPGSIMQSVDSLNLRDWLEGCDKQAKDLKPISRRAYAVALAKKIQAAHWMGCVEKGDVAEYARAMHGRIGRYYWAEHYRHPILVNRLTWSVLGVARLLLNR